MIISREEQVMLMVGIIMKEKIVSIVLRRKVAQATGKDTYYNVLGNYYEHPSSVVVINPEVRPPVPARFRSSNDRDN